MTIEELSDVGNAAMSEFEGLRCGKQTTLAFVQSGKGVTHRLLHRPRIPGNHRGFLPKAENPFPDRPDYQPNRVPKRPNATVNKFCILGRVDNSWVNLRRLGNELGGILEPFVLVIILSWTSTKL